MNDFAKRSTRSFIFNSYYTCPNARANPSINIADATAKRVSHTGGLIVKTRALEKVPRNISIRFYLATTIRAVNLSLMSTELVPE